MYWTVKWGLERDSKQHFESVIIKMEEGKLCT